MHAYIHTHIHSHTHTRTQVRGANIKLDRLTLRHLGGEGEEDYWSGGLCALKAVSGMMELTECVVSSERGTGVVVSGSGKAVLTNCSVLDCGHYGVGADGRDALVDLRDCMIDGSKYEEFDERNGARIVGAKPE
jgi:hypothetical protein